MKKLIFIALLAFALQAHGQCVAPSVRSVTTSTDGTQACFLWEAGTCSLQRIIPVNFTATQYGNPMQLLWGGGGGSGTCFDLVCGQDMILTVRCYCFDVHQYPTNDWQTLEALGVLYQDITMTYSAVPCPPVPVNYGGLIYNKKGKPNNGHGH